MGLNVVQNLIGPAKDRMGHGIFAKTASVIPGLGNAVGSVTELLLGAGIVMKSCVGTAGLVVLVLISLVPLLKALCLAFFYKLAAAVTEPVSDKRISGCLKGLANGGMLYVKLLGYSVLLFFCDDRTGRRQRRDLFIEDNGKEPMNGIFSYLKSYVILFLCSRYCLRWFRRRACRSISVFFSQMILVFGLLYPVLGWMGESDAFWKN